MQLKEKISFVKPATTDVWIAQLNPTEKCAPNVKITCSCTPEPVNKCKKTVFTGKETESDLTTAYGVNTGTDSTTEDVTNVCLPNWEPSTVTPDAKGEIAGTPP